MVPRLLLTNSARRPSKKNVGKFQAVNNRLGPHKINFEPPQTIVEIALAWVFIGIL
jgi:hypothetical protein